MPKSFRIELLVKLAIIAMIIFTMFRGTFTSEEEAIKVLKAQGYSDIKITDKAIFFITLRGGSKADAAMFTAQVKNPTGQKVTAYVYIGWPFKGPTIKTR